MFLLLAGTQMTCFYFYSQYLTERPEWNSLIPATTTPTADHPSCPSSSPVFSVSSDPFLDEEERQLHQNFLATIQTQLRQRGRVADPYFFIHIAKTGGTSFADSLERHPAGPVSGAGVIFSHYWDHDHLDVPFTVRRTMPERYIHVVGGHLCYGIHRWWASENQELPEFTYLTILRHPVARVKSHYRYHLGATDPNHYLTRNRTFVEWAMNVKWAQNVMTGYMAGSESYAWWNEGVVPLQGPGVLFPGTIVTERQYREARRNLITSLVGLQESYEDSLILLNGLLGLQLQLRKSNTASHPYTFTEEEEAVIIMVNHWDLELYKLGVYLHHQLKMLLHYIVPG